MTRKTWAGRARGGSAAGTWIAAALGALAVVVVLTSGQRRFGLDDVLRLVGG